jgi:NAD(P)-dependent dehydrogenase (short-subunit alcohol dehydrogenase family)
MTHILSALRRLRKENLMIRVQYLINFLVVTFFVISVPTHAISQSEIKMKSVLVTGASTGIGRNLAETLASNGYHVYAGARKDKDLSALNALNNITAVKLDVTKQDQIDAVVALIRDNDTGLYALVNNAGIGNGGAISQTPIEDHNMVYRVNVEGVYRVTKAFSPLIIESKGRISTTGSIAGTIARAGGSAYSGSKHWIEAFTDALALEMAPLDVMVSVIEPGNFQSHIRRSGVLRFFDKVKAAGGEITPDMQKMFTDTSARELSYKKPDEVSAAFMHALFDDKPLRRYVVTPNQQEQAYTISTKLRQLVELNQWGPYSYTREQLVEMLDKTITEKAK